MNTKLTSLALALCLALPVTALAQEAAPRPQPTDYRAYVFGAYLLVFLCILVYLVVSHRRTVRLHDELDHLESRLERLETRG
jgi:CcmD family protein